MAFIVSFSGSHGVGKTSLVNNISNHLPSFLKENKDYKILKELNTSLFNIGLSLNGNGFDFNEVMFSQKQAFDLGYNICKYYIEKDSDNRIIFTDRCCVDTYLYTKYFLSKKLDVVNEYSDMLKDMELKTAEIIKNITTILISPFQDFEVLDDRMSIQERDDVWLEFLNYFDSMSNKCVYYKTNRQTTQERCLEVVSLLNPKLTQLKLARNI